jgi:hypothetical protein
MPHNVQHPDEAAAVRPLWPCLAMTHLLCWPCGPTAAGPQHTPPRSHACAPSQFMCTQSPVGAPGAAGAGGPGGEGGVIARKLRKRNAPTVWAEFSALAATLPGGGINLGQGFPNWVSPLAGRSLARRCASLAPPPLRHHLGLTRPLISPHLMALTRAAPLLTHSPQPPPEFVLEAGHAAIDSANNQVRGKGPITSPARPSPQGPPASWASRAPPTPSSLAHTHSTHARLATPPSCGS